VIFSWDRQKCNCILFSWGSDICVILYPMVEILTLSPHNLLKNFGALMKYAKCSQSLTKIEILTLYPGYDGMIKKPSHTTVPLSTNVYHYTTFIYGYKC
jgi:hypothetical protein